MDVTDSHQAKTATYVLGSLILKRYDFQINITNRLVYLGELQRYREFLQKKKCYECLKI